MVNTPRIPGNPSSRAPRITPPIVTRDRADYSAIPREVARIKGMPIPNLAMLICHIMNKNGLLTEQIALEDNPAEFMGAAHMVKEVLKKHEGMQPGALLNALENPVEQFNVARDLATQYATPKAVAKLTGPELKDIKVLDCLAVAYVFLPSHLNDFIM
jgi:hypothetical protein